ncbi:MAG: DUF4276 family protein [Deltaproteobacteria bacterium]|nr:MAG: DUF4276 family protein [Deltaproteobacteria bacterium]
MKANHLEFLVEEPSMEAFLRALLPRLLPDGHSFDVHPFNGKDDLLGKLESRLRGYARWLPPDWRIVVVVDRDDDDCTVLKGQLEGIARRAGLRSRTEAGSPSWQIVNRIAIEELEAWYFGDWAAVQAAYPGVKPTLPRQRKYRDPDAITGGTWEAFERVLQKHRYYPTGLPKVEAARTLGAHIDPSRTRSKSFEVFCHAVLEATR